MKNFLNILPIFLICFLSIPSYSQGTDAVIVGDVQCLESAGCHIPYATIVILGTSIGTASDATGHFMLTNLPVGRHRAKASAIGYKSSIVEVELHHNETVEIKFKLEEDLVNLESVVITATRLETERSEAPVIVGIIDDRIFEVTQAVNLAEGLSFQPGLRVENNCQNCGYTQVRINGLDGTYSQILMNSRPVFSALQGVYGLEQIPANMIDRVEVVRGGGSALYGGNAIGGTINIITKEPFQNTFQFGSSHALIDGRASDHLISGTLALVTDDLKSGATIYGNYRNTDEFDANGDGYSELSKISNTTFGGNIFYRPNSISKIKSEFYHINEFRRGGNRFAKPPHRADVAEQIDHEIIGGGLTFEGYSKNSNNRYSIYSSAQHIKRKSYYGFGGNPENEDLYGDLPQDIRESLAAEASNYYGNTDDFIWVNGLQYYYDFKTGNLTMGLEQRYNSVNDNMSGYNRYINQKTQNIGIYSQYEMKLVSNFRVLMGLRFDFVRVNGSYILFDDKEETKKNFDALSPRVSLLYFMRENIQARLGYARGFRAPQAFDEDLHINSVGGTTQFIMFADNLEQEKSDAITASLDFTGKAWKGQYSLLLEGFYTILHDSFVNVGLFEGDGQSTPSVFEKRNATEDATVSGMNIEGNYSPSNRLMIQVGGTGQKAVFSKPIEYYASEDTYEESIWDDRILRSPSFYGYFITTWSPFLHLEVNISGNYTGTMAVAYESGLQKPIGIYETPDYLTFNLKFGYDFQITDEFTFQIYCGIRNMFNSYQNDFDKGIFRDASYIYGPVRPRVFFAGLKIGNFL